MKRARGNLHLSREKPVGFFLQRQHSRHAWELAFKVLWLPSQIEPYCHVPNKERTISPKQRNRKAAVEAHSNWNLSVCMGPPLSSWLYYFCASTSQLDEEEEEWLIFHSSCLIKGFQDFLGQHKGKGCLLLQNTTLKWFAYHHKDV